MEMQWQEKIPGHVALKGQNHKRINTNAIKIWLKNENVCKNKLTQAIKN